MTSKTFPCGCDCPDAETCCASGICSIEAQQPEQVHLAAPQAGVPSAASELTPRPVSDAAPTEQGTQSRLTVRFGPMPESNGRTNWTAILHRGDISEGFTIARSEYPGRVRYEADRVRFLIGELDKKPWILDYDGDERTPCHLCGGTGDINGKPCWGLNFEGPIHGPIQPQGAASPQGAVSDAENAEGTCASNEPNEKKGVL